MRVVLLDVGGYSLADCLDSFEVKYRHNGSLYLKEWFTHTKYKIEVILDSLPFLSHCTNKMIESMAKTFSLIGILAGLPQDRRELVFSKEAQSTDDFLKDCIAFSPSPHDHHRHRPYHHHSRSSYSGHQYQKSQQSSSSNFPRQQQPQFNNYSHHDHHGNSYRPPPNGKFRAPLLAQPPSYPPPARRDVDSVLCFKCNTYGHYANVCPNAQSFGALSLSQPQSNPQPGYSNRQTNNSQQQNTVPAKNTGQASRGVNAVTQDDTPDTQISTDDFEEGFIVRGKINHIPTNVLIDAGAKISLMSSSFVPADSTPVRFIAIKGVSQQPMSVPVYNVHIDIPTLAGSFQVAVLDRLPADTILLGTDFGKDRLLALMSSVKSSPEPVYWPSLGPWPGMMTEPL